MQRRRYLTLLGAGIALAGCTESGDGSDEAAPAETDDSDDPTPTPEPDTPEPDQDTPTATEEETETPTPEPEQSGELERNAVGYPSDFIEVHSVEYNENRDDDWGDPTVTGVVDNVYDGELDYVSVSIQAFDENDVQIGDGLDNTTDLREGRSWQFEVLLWDVDPDDIDHWMGRAEVTVW